MQDGRSKQPTPPAFVQLEMTTASINHFLNTHYTPQEIANMPEMWIYKMKLLIEAQHNGR